MRKNKLSMIIVFMLTMQLTRAQNFAWAMQLGNASEEASHAITTDPTGQVINVGKFSGGVNFNPNGISSLLASGLNSGYILKLDATDNLAWVRAIRANTSAECQSVKTDALGNVYVTGFFEGVIDLNPSPLATANFTSNGQQDAFVVKLDPSGNYVWGCTFGGTGWESALAITVDANGNSYIGGDFDGSVDFDPGVGTLLLSPAGFGSPIDAFILKLDVNGNFVWAKQFRTTTSNEVEIRGLEVDGTSNVYAVGAFRGTADFDPSLGTFTLASSSQAKDIFVSKLDVNGNFVWAKQFASTVVNAGYGIALDASNNVYTTGSFASTVDFDPSPTSTFTLTSASGFVYDIFVSKLDANGNFVWAKQIGGTSTDEGKSITVRGSSVYLTGYFSDAVDFNPGLAADTKTAVAPSNDAFICSLDLSGNYNWSIQLGAGDEETGTAIATTTSGVIYTTGTFQGTVDFDHGAGVTSFTEPSNAAEDQVFIHKIQVCDQLSVNNTTICAGNSFTIVPSGAVSYTFQGGSAVVNPTVTTTYTVAGTTTAGCVSEAAVQVSVNPTPILNLSGGQICAGSSFTINPSGANTYTIQGGSAVVSPTNTTTYSVTGTNTLGCISPAVTITVSVNSPTMTVSSNTTVCAGSQLTLTAIGSAITAYTWTSPTNGGSTASLVTSPTVSSNYTVVGNDANSCLVTKTVAVTVNALPNVTAQANFSLICNHLPVELTAQGASSYLWSNNANSATTTVVNVNQLIAGTYIYTVTGTGTNGCKKTATVSVLVQICGAVNEMQKTQLVVSIYPNPNNGHFTIKTSPGAEIRIVDMLGKTLSSFILPESGEQSIEHLAKGVYFIIGEENGLRFNNKIVVD